MSKVNEIEFNVNETLKLTLSQSALQHVLLGDVSERLKTKDGKRTGEKEKILKGGMHTVKGFLDLKSSRDDIEHLMFYDSNKYKYWYYARELQNGVINLRLPKDIFQSKAAKLTNFPDENYKSGYLWKTLFPEGWGQDELIDVTMQALQNIDDESTRDGEIVGYALNDDPLKTMRVCILHRNGEINSIFPSWTQPCTGNNGKPYSHFDSIGHIISESTLYFDSKHRLKTPPETSLLGEDIVLSNLPYYTPKFIRDREFVGNEDIDGWTNRKNRQLLDFAGNSDDEVIKMIKSYLLDLLIVKDNHLTPRYIYDNHFFEVIFSKEKFNSFHMPQNIIDGINVVFYYDLLHRTNQIKCILEFLLKNMVTHTGCLDSWNKKRILNTMIEVVLSHHDKSLVSSFLYNLSESPFKRELFVDINCATFDKLDLDVEDVVKEDGMLDFSLINVHLTLQEVACKINHFEYFYKLSLGETYLTMFNQDALESVFEEHHNFNLKSFIADSLKFTSSRDLMLFSEQFERMVEHMIGENKCSLDESTLLGILKDYYRIQSAQRLRYNLYYKDVIDKDLDYGNPKSKEFIRGTCLKHERLCNQHSIMSFFDSCEKLASYMDFVKLQKEVEKQRENFSKQVPPLPDRNHLKVGT